MRIRKHSRIVAMALALVMILPLISIPTFAEDTAEATPLDWSQNFDSAASVSDVLYGYPSTATLENGALRLEYAAYDDGKYYVMTDQNSAYAISDAEVTEGTLTGTVTINKVDYAVSGTVNSEDVRVPSVKATLSPADGAPATAYIVTAKTMDAWRGGLNVGSQTKVKNDAITASDYGKVYISADYFVSANVNSGSSFELTWTTSGTGTSGNTRADLGKIGVHADYISLDYHGDADKGDGEQKAGYASLKAPKGQWFTVSMDIDLTTGTVVQYLNGEYARTLVDIDIPTGLAANGWNLLQISRGSTQAPSVMTGYMLIDNATLTSEKDLFYSADFDQYAGLTNAELKTGTTYGENFAKVTQFPSKTTVETVDGDSYFRHAMGTDVAGTAYDVDYFSYATASVNGDSYYYLSKAGASITSVDLANNSLVLSDGNTYTITPAAAAKVALGYYGTFVYNDITFALVSGDYAGAVKVGDNNVDKCISLRIPPVSYAEHSEIYLEVDYFIEEGSKGETQIQFYQTTQKDGATAKNYLDLYNINLATGKLNRGGYLPIGQWTTLGLKINMVTGYVTFYVDNVKVSGVSLGVTNLELHPNGKAYTSSSLIISKIFKTEGNLTATGAIYVDDVRMGTTAIMGETTSNVVLADYNFENQTVGSAPSGVFTTLESVETTVDNTLGSKAWKVDYAVKTAGGSVGATDANGNKNKDRSSYVTVGGSSYQLVDSVVFEADYFIEVGATGQLQSQINPVKYDGGSKAWADLYVINFTGSSAGTLKRAGGASHGSAVFPLGQWNTVSAVLNMKNGDLDVYLNGVLAIDSQIIMNTTTLTNLSFDANKWVVGKANNGGDFLGSGTFYMDNLKVFEGTKPSVTASDVNDFEQFKYLEDGTSVQRLGFASVPKLATITTYNGNTVLRLGMGSYMSNETYALYTPAGSGKILAREVECYYDEGYLVYNGGEYDFHYDDPNGVPYVLIPDAEENDVKYYVVTDALAEAAHGAGGNVGTALTPSHGSVSYKDTKMAMLSADYLIEEGSTGKAEMQFAGAGWMSGDANGGTWAQLFKIDVATGQLQTGSGGETTMWLNIGEWNNIKLIVDLETGKYDVYANDVWAFASSFPKANVTILKDSWILAKAMRHNNPAGSVYEGAILIDNVTVTAETPVSTSTINNKFLSDDAFNAFFADTLTQVDAASIRLRDPSGLRFASLVDDHKLAHLKTIFGKDATFKMGTLITPYAYAKAAGDTVVTRASLDALDITSAKYLDVEFDGTYFQGETGMDVGENTYMVGSIVNIKANNITRQFAGIGYLEIVVGEDVVASQYTTPTYRSVQVVAQAALEAQTAGNVTFTTGQNAILAAYAAGQQPS